MRELEEMANTNFACSHSYYSVLKMSNNIKRLTRLTRNEELIKKFKEDIGMFPYFKEDLLRIFNSAIQARNESYLIEDRLFDVFGYSLPSLIQKKLVENLTVEDLPL